MRIRLMAMLAGPALVAAAPAFADVWDFVLINDTGKEITLVEVAVTGSDKWQPNKVDPDIKAEKSIKAAGRTSIHFDKSSSECRFDIRATFADNSNAVWTNVNICDNAYVTVRYRNDTPTFAAN